MKKVFDFLSKGWLVGISGFISLVLIIFLPFRHDIGNLFITCWNFMTNVYGYSLILLFSSVLVFIITLINFILKKNKNQNDKRPATPRKQYNWKIIGVVLIFIFLFDMILFQTVTEAISKSDSAVILAILALIVSEEKLLHNFVVLNDDNIKDDKTIVSKKITVIIITALIVVSSSAALLHQTLKYFNVHIEIFGIIIIAMVFQLIILKIIDKHITNNSENYKESIIYKFFAN